MQGAGAGSRQALTVPGVCRHRGARCDQNPGACVDAAGSEEQSGNSLAEVTSEVRARETPAPLSALPAWPAGQEDPARGAQPVGHKRNLERKARCLLSAREQHLSLQRCKWVEWIPWGLERVG